MTGHAPSRLWPLLLPTLFPAVAVAAPLDDFALRVGGFASRLETSLHLEETAFYSSTTIDFDKELALDEQSVVEFASVSSRPWTRHQFDISYFDLRLSGDRHLQRDIEFEGEHFVIDSTVRSRLSVRSLEFSYTYWALLDEEWALGFRFGYMDYQLRASLGLLLGADGDPPELMAVARVDEHVPAPSLGVDYRLAIAPDWRLKFRFGWLERRLTSVSPRVITMHVGVEFLPWKNFGAWADFGINRLEIDTRRDDYNGALRFDEGGLRVGGTWRF